MINVSSTQSLRFCVECTQVPFFSQIMGTNACENATETVIRIIWKCASWRPCHILHCYGLELWAVGWHMDLRWLSFKMNAPLKKRYTFSSPVCHWCSLLPAASFVGFLTSSLNLGMRGCWKAAKALLIWTTIQLKKTHFKVLLLRLQMSPFIYTSFKIEAKGKRIDKLIK